MDREPQDHVSLSPEDAAFVDEQVKSGRFQSPDEVVKRALLNFRETDQFFVATVDELNAKIEEGLRDVAEGRVLDLDEVLAELDELDKAAEAKRKKRA